MSKACFRKQTKSIKEKQKFHFCFKDFGQRESLGCWSAATAIRGLWSKRILGMTMRSIGYPETLVKDSACIYKTDSILFLANEQAPSIPAFSPSFDIFNLVSVFTKLNEYLLIALLVGRRK